MRRKPLRNQSGFLDPTAFETPLASIQAQDGSARSVPMTLTATHHGISHLAHLPRAEGLDPHTAQQPEAPPHPGLQDHVGAGVGLQDTGHRAGLA